jgi:glycosyltransferase involved in cell wall biosynthesis
MSAAAALLAANVDGRGRHRREALRDRLATVLRTLDGDVDATASSRALLDRLAATLAAPDPDRIWLTLAVLRGRLPRPDMVEAAVRSARLCGPLTALRPALLAARPGRPWTRGPWPTVEVVIDQVLVDVHHTAETSLATGIQRVARQAVRRWVRDHDPLLVGWTPRYTGLRALSPAERTRALFGQRSDAVRPTRDAGAMSTVVPWKCRYVLPELAAEPERAYALQALLRFSGTRGSMIGFDCVPISSGETSAFGMGTGFALMLTAAAHVDRIATISEGAATEYRGWRRMLAGAGLSGPEIAAVPLAVEAETPDLATLAETRDLLLVGGRPMVLVVGSHEPRKNHMAVLHAAEVLWRRGRSFTVTFVGGNSWHSEDFVSRLADLLAAGRPIQSLSNLSDSKLWAAYRLARCVVFPSFNEGFGLPVAESLASGTPVITSNFGSMREVTTAGGGVLLIDPRADSELVTALDRLITDDVLHARLSAQARDFPTRSWDDYAAEAWTFLTGGDREAHQRDLAVAGGR